MNYSKIIFTVLVFSMTSACSSSYITTSWKKPGAQTGAYHKIMVIGLIREAEKPLREKMENHLVGDLNALGYDAWSSLALYGPRGFISLDTLAAYNKLKADSIDAVITVVLLDKKKEKLYVPGRKFQIPYSDYNNHLWNYYTTMQGRIDGKDYYEEITEYFWESNFYDLQHRQLVYSVPTQSFDPPSTGSLAHQYGQMIVNNMVKNDVLARQTDKLNPL
jgi:hypothetical protein